MALGKSHFWLWKVRVYGEEKRRREGEREKRRREKEEGRKEEEEKKKIRYGNYICMNTSFNHFFYARICMRI